MEPALDERGDKTALDVHETARMPQWSPLSTSGATTTRPRAGRLSTGPQWSPLSTSGATRAGPAGSGRRGEAAMEPALDERGDPGTTPTATAP